MLALANTAFTNFITPVTTNYQVIVNRPFQLIAFIGDERSEVIKKIEELVCQDGYEVGDVYFINKNGVTIQYFNDGRVDVRLTGDSMAEVMDIYVKTMLVEYTSFKRSASTLESAHYEITGDVIGFILNLSEYHGFEVKTTETDGDYTYEVNTHLFNMFITQEEDRDRVLDVEIFY